MSHPAPAGIDGVRVVPLTTHADDRGYFREIFRLQEAPLENAAQLSVTHCYPGVIKAFHYHRKQDDLWYCASGMIQAVLHDLRPGSPTRGVTQTVILGDHQPQILFIPRGVAHGYRVLGETSALVVYATSEVYNPDDELRLAHDDPQIGFDWTTHPR